MEFNIVKNFKKKSGFYGGESAVFVYTQYLAKLITNK